MPKKKTKSPPILSHEFVIQNHADIVSGILCVCLIGFFFEPLKGFSELFGVQYKVEHNKTSEGESDEVVEDSTEGPTVYGRGMLDLCNLFAQTCLWIIIQAIIQEFFLEKLVKKFHLSKTKHSRFTEAFQVFTWSLFAVLYGTKVFIINNGYLSKLSEIWESYPENTMDWESKTFMIFQMAMWVMMYSQLYFMKTRNEEMEYRIKFYSIHLIFIATAYTLHHWRLCILLMNLHYFTQVVGKLAKMCDYADNKSAYNTLSSVWCVMFPFTRVVTALSSLYVFMIKLASSEHQGFNWSQGLANTSTTRLVCCLSVCLLQVWMLLQFINMQNRRKREAEKIRQMEKKAAQQLKESKKTKKDTKKVKAN